MDLLKIGMLVGKIEGIISKTTPSDVPKNGNFYLSTQEELLDTIYKLKKEMLIK